MGWTKPKTTGQWLVLLVPAVELLVAKYLANVLPIGKSATLGVLVFGSFGAFALSLGLGLWLARPTEDEPDRLALGFGFAVATAVVNGAIAFACCSRIGFLGN